MEISTGIFNLVLREYILHCVSKTLVSDFLHYLNHLLTNFKNSFTVGNSNVLSKNKFNISRHFLKTLLHDKAVPNFYDNFVNC